MTQHAHTSDLKPRRLPNQWRDPETGNTIMGLALLSPTELAALGWYPVTREPLAEGADGYGDAYLDEAAQQVIIPSLPADPEAAHERYLDGLSCRKRQGMLELAEMGLLEAVETYFENASLDAQIWFEYETDWRFRDPRVQAVGEHLELSESQMVQMFESARQR